MARYVLDTNQIVAAGTGWIDKSAEADDSVCERRLLIHVVKNETGLYCGKIMGEYLEKLIDRKHPPDRAARLISYLMGLFERVDIVSAKAHHPPTDADDEIFLLCAIDGKADYLISHDKSLLGVAAHYPQFSICRAEVETGRLGI
jgi:predicted nucleic acid-binding protein